MNQVFEFFDGKRIVETLLTFGHILPFFVLPPSLLLLMLLHSDALPGMQWTRLPFAPLFFRQPSNFCISNLQLNPQLRLQCKPWISPVGSSDI